MKSIVYGIRAIILAGMAALAVAGCVKQTPAPGAAPPPRFLQQEKKIVVARVNGSEITRFTLVNMINRMYAINSRASSTEPPEETGKKALDQLIFRELAAQEAARLGLSVEEQRIDDEMNRFIKSVGHEEGYQHYLQDQNTTPVEVRFQVARSLLLQLIAVREVAEKVSVSDDDVRMEYERLKDRYITPGKVVVADVLVLVKQDDPASAKTANELLAKMNASKDKGPWGLASGGTFTVISRDLDKSREPVLYDEARKLREGELSGVLYAADGLHIIQLNKYTPAKQAAFEEVKGSLRQGLLAVAQVRRFQEWERELKKDAKIEILDVTMLPSAR